MTSTDNEERTRVVGSMPATSASPGPGLPEAGSGFGIPPGTLLAHTYRFERLLGGGGMGEVYVAEHVGLGTRHAIKVIRPSMARNRQVMDLFYREAKVLRGVRHDAVVSYDGFIRDDTGRDYLVMEYVEGPSLAERLRDGPLPVGQVLTLRDRLAAGLAEAHRRGAVHRDISPDNVILPGRDVAAAKLIDFGLSKLTDPAQESIVGSSFAGKYRFASPEQFGLFGGDVDARSDIYSLGLILAAAALGRPLDMGDSFEATLEAHRRLPDLRALPAAVRPWLEAMLQPDPAARPKDMAALLGAWPAGGAAVADPHAGTVVMPPRTRGRGAASDGQAPPPPRPPLLVVSLLVVVLGAGGWLWWQLRPLPVDGPTESDPTVDVVTSPDGPSGRRPDEGRADVGEPEETRLATLLAAGRTGAAFERVEQEVQAGRPPPPQTWQLAQALLGAGELDRAFALARVLAAGGHGPAAFLVAEMYDPLHWSEGGSPFSRPNPDKAVAWYRRAQGLGVAAAAGRLQALSGAEPPQ